MFLLFLAIPWPTFGQGIIWQAAIWDSVPASRAYRPRFSGGQLWSAVAHPNGGLLGLGISQYLRHYPIHGSDPVDGIVSLRISASGDSLGLYKLPGVLNSGLPVFIRNSPDPSQIWALISRDTIVTYIPNTYNREPFMAHLDTSGALLDSFTVPLANPTNYIRDAAFVTPKKILVLGSSIRNFTTQLDELDASMISWPEGLVLWRRTYAPNQSFNKPSAIVETSDKKIYLVGAFGTHLGAQRIDTMGNQIGGYVLYTDTVGGGVNGQAMPLPHDRFAVKLSYGGPMAGNPNRPLYNAIAVVDTNGRCLWKRTYVGTRGDIGYQLLIGANQDGSILTMYAPSDREAVIQRYDSTGNLMASWPVYNTTSDTIGYPYGQGVTYLGNNKAYLYGIGGLSRPDPNHQKSRYWAAYVDGVGEQYNPLAVPRPIMRAEMLAVSLYPNPATDILRGDSEKELEYRMFSSTGSFVGQGKISQQKPVDIAGLAPGVYQMVLLDGNRALHKRFAKQ